MKLRQRLGDLFLVALMGSLAATTARAVERDTRLEAIRAVGPKGEGHQAAIQAARELNSEQLELLPKVLAAMDGSSPLAENWLRGIAESIVQRNAEQGRQVSPEVLQQFIRVRSHSPRARRLAYEFLLENNPELASGMIPEWLDDPSLELRREAVQLVLKQAQQAEEKGDTAEAQKLYSTAFAASRDLDQIKDTAANLKRLSAEPDITRHMGFVTEWHVVGPFDNTDKQGFDEVYPPEEGVGLDESYKGKEGPVSWQKASTDDAYGLLDLNEVLGQHKGAIAYAYCTIHSDAQRDVELRLGCINGNKVWLNGELLTSNHVYHANTFVDQYVGKGKLRAGKNEILVKIAQNEQTEDWAQRWGFQLRVCDAIGTPIAPAK